MITGAVGVDNVLLQQLSQLQVAPLPIGFGMTQELELQRTVKRTFTDGTVCL